jgi:acetyl esterase/lipase
LAGYSVQVVRAVEPSEKSRLASDQQVAGVQIVRDLAYRDLYPGEDAKRGKNKLDLYLPAGLDKFPVIVFIHGGAWIHGNKNQLSAYRSLGIFWARQGIGMVAINYRLSPGAKHPEHIKDVARAFAWTYRNINNYGGRPDRIFVCGHSAGGHLAALLASDETYLHAEGLSEKAIRGVIAVSGVYRVHDLDRYAGANNGDASPAAGAIQVSSTALSTIFGKDQELRKKASPVTHVRAGLPPFLILYAERDLPMLSEMAREFGSGLQEHGSPVETVEIKDRNHMSILRNICTEGDPACSAIEKFLIRQGAKQ